LADLFAALLISTFGGLVLIGTSGARQSGDVANKDKEIATLTATVRELSDELNKSEEGRRYLAETLKAQQARIDKDRGGKGLDLPPCLARDGRPLPLIEITVSDDGVEVRKLPQPEYEQLTRGITGLQALTAAGRINDKNFSDLAGSIAAWGRDSGNALGFSCAFYATLKPGAISKDRFSTARAYVEDGFYIYNAAEIRRFMKTREN
jgi:hypothetical protein